MTGGDYDRGGTMTMTEEDEHYRGDDKHDSGGQPLQIGMANVTEGNNNHDRGG